MSDWPSGRPARGTTLPVGIANLEFYWDVDAVNHVTWHMIYDAALSKWLFLGGPDLVAEVATSETTTSTSYAALTTAGPTLTTPGVGGGIYVVEIGAATAENAASATTRMSYDIGGTGAVDADSLLYYSGSSTNAPIPQAQRKMVKTFAAAVALTCKYKVSGGTGTWQLRWMSIRPIQVNPS